MKRFLSLTLALAMLLVCISATAEHVSFTATTTHTNSDMDYTSDELYQFISEKFDFDAEVWPVSKDQHDEKVRMWINGGTMPDMLIWRNFNYQEYVTYAEQGLLKELPEGWQEKYPNLYDMYKTTGIYDQMAVDGLYYGIPHTIYYRFAQIETPVPQHATFYYRKDWASKLGFEFGASIKMKDIAAYLRACIDNDMAGNGNTIGLTETPAGMANLFMMFSDYNYDQDFFVKMDDGYHWILDNGKIATGVNMARDWYEQGLLDPDFYLLNIADATGKFTTGLAAAMFDSCSVPSHYAFRKTFEEATGLNANNIGLAAIESDDGVVQANETDNYWSVSFFSPNLSDEVFARLLELMDWACTEEGELTIMVGLKDKAWTYNEDGSIKILLEADDSGAFKSSQDVYNSFQLFRGIGALADDYSFINPGFDTAVVQSILDVFAAKRTGKMNRIDYNYKFFASDAKADYSVDIASELTYLIITKDIDVDAEIAKFVSDNQGVWQPVVDDLNAAFMK